MKRLLPLVRTSILPLLSLLAGCGIADMRAVAPQVAVTFRSASGVTAVDVICPKGPWADRAFIALVGRGASSTDRDYEWKRLNISSSSLPVSCAEDERTIGVAFIPLLMPFITPSEEDMKSRELFLGIPGEPSIYRVRVTGRSARVEATDREAARLRLPRPLEPPDPNIRSPEWRERIRAEIEFYRNTPWQPSDRITVSVVNTDGNGGILSLRVDIGQEG